MEDPQPTLKISRVSQMARRFAMRIGAIRFAEKTPIFLITCERFARITSNLRFAIFSPPEARFAKEGIRVGNPETIREESGGSREMGESIRANRAI